MKALVYTDTQMSEIREVEAPKVDENQCLVDITFCGICGSDMHAWLGHDERRIPPLVLGHEAVGIVRTGDLTGKRVAINPLMTCGDCIFCNNGNEHLCLKRELIGMRVPGAFSERLAIDVRNLNVIADNLSFTEAALVEPLACSVHAVRIALDLSGQDFGSNFVVVGGGAIGLLAALVLEAYGYSNIWLAETNYFRLEMLKKIGNIQAFDPLNTAPSLDKIDVIIDAVGSGATRKMASNLVQPGGTIVHIGLQDNTAGLDTRRLTLQEIKFQGTYCYRNDDFSEALTLLSMGKVSGNGWVEIRSLSDGAQSFVDIHNGNAPPKIILQTSEEE
ncbi:alcohol dehydrogenase catalytic domain-containing protein [Candidatus Puniceispirillum sp.]|nr:alcohol dehydrogenase catalytic domain-containing protein [Candidatus Puniceispirillum sp.]